MISRDCRNISVEVPYIKEEKQCDEVTFDECQEVEVRVPVDICKRRRYDEDSIFLSRGKVFRKEGELRRTTLFRRNLTVDRQRNATESRTSGSQRIVDDIIGGDDDTDLESEDESDDLRFKL